MAGVIVILVFFLIINAANSVPVADDLVLTLPDGKIQGATYVTGNNRTYYGFRGIPFATPPLGDLRLELPQPAQPWEEIWDATSDRKNCISYTYLYTSEHENEDCLYVNVYVPTLEPDTKLPVLFWIHGGAYREGNSSKSHYGPDFLIEEDVILVSFSYRLGPFGFISTGDGNLPGNLGLKDQNLALKWTNRNIEYFGGDPSNIIIFGESAGGSSVSLHLLSKLSAGLFKAAIVESGSSLNSWSVELDPRSVAYSLADLIPEGNYGNDTQALKEFLKSRTVDEIMTANTLLPDIRFWPTLEEESEDAFLTEAPYQSLDTGNYNQVPIMIGICAEESLMLMGDLASTKALALAYDLDPSLVIPEHLLPNATDQAEVIEKIRSIFLKEGETFSSNLVGFADYQTDELIARGVIKQAELLAIRTPVYLYQFAYSGRPLTPPYIDGAEKASHAAELPFIFNMEGASETTEPQDLLVQRRMVTLWTNFAKYLNPTPTKSDLFDNLIWPVLDKQTSLYLNINNSVEIRANVKENYYSKWNDIFETFGKKPFITF